MAHAVHVLISTGCLRWCALLLLLLLLPWTYARPPISLEREDDTDPMAATTAIRKQPLLLARLLDAEQSAVERQLAFYKRKVAIVKALVARYDAGAGVSSANRSGTQSMSGTQASRSELLKLSRQRARRQQHQLAHDQLFSDWFERLGPYYPLVDQHSSSPQPIADNGDKSGAGQYRVDLFSFRPIASIGSKKNHPHTQRLGSAHPATEASTASLPLLQFLTVLNITSGRLDLLHPLTKQVVWQHSLSPTVHASPIADYFFVSERKSFLAVLRENGEVSLFKLRVLHNRRLLSGDHRHSSRSDRAVCLRASGASPSVTSGALSESVMTPLWAVAASTTAPAANHLHIDFELVFRADTSSWRADRHGRAVKIAVVSLYSSAYVLVSASDGALSFFNAENGSLLKTVPAGEAPSGVTRFKALASGVVALAVGSRIRFANAAKQSVLHGVSCDVGAMDMITSIESDPWHHSVLYAGTTSGRGLVFRLLHFDRARRLSVDTERSSEQRRGWEQPACVLVGQVRSQTVRVPVLHQPTLTSPVFVRTMPGYLVVATRAQVALFETSADGVEMPRYLTELALPSTALSLMPEQIVALSVSRDPLAHPAALAVYVLEPSSRGTNSTSSAASLESRLRVDMYGSLLPPPTSSLDLGWLRAPVMLLCAVAVMYWQQRGANDNYGRAGDFDRRAFARMAAARGQLHPYQRHQH